MGGSSIFALGRATYLNDDDHMMRCKNYNSDAGIIYREGAGRGQASAGPTPTTVIIRESG
jgi:hypothetical protein